MLIKRFFIMCISILLTATNGIAQKDIKGREGITMFGDHAIKRTTQELMSQKSNAIYKNKSFRKKRHQRINRNMRQNPHSPAVSHYPYSTSRSLIDDEEIFNDASCNNDISASKKPQNFGVNFLGARLDNNAEIFPPDAMGAVGPTQFLVTVNGRFRSFDKTTGLPDGILDETSDDFFASVRGGNSTTDPRTRYDRLSQRWFIIMITETNVNDTILFAVSDSKNITSATVWSFFSIALANNTFFDQPTLGIDANALYVGGIEFQGSGEDPADTQVYVVNKDSLLSGGPIQFTLFTGLVDPITLAGPFVPHGVDNFDANATTGYFISPANGDLGTIILVPVLNPGSATPTLGTFINLIVPQTQNPINVPHKGNNNGTDGYLDDGADTRFMMGQIMNNRLWASQTVSVDNTGVSPSDISLATRDAGRWYEIDLSPDTPVIKQVGTLFAPSADNTNDQRSYLYPSVMISGQGHMAIGATAAGMNEYINAAASGRLASDPLGTLRPASLYTRSNTAYNPAGDPGTADQVRRWGDYSYLSLDPCDNMTMWAIQEYCNDTDSWGVRVAQLKAPVPAYHLTAIPSTIPRGQSSIDVLIKGDPSVFSGFYDPGTAFDCRLQVTANKGVVVNSVTYKNPKEIVINISTMNVVRASNCVTITVTNPDGQSISEKILTLCSSHCSR